MQVNQSSMMAHANYMASSANNVANVNTEGYEASRTTLQNSAQENVQAVSASTQAPTSIAREMTDQISVENGFDAQVRSIQTQDDALGTMLDIRS